MPDGNVAWAYAANISTILRHNGHATHFAA